jgi:hypothetical protein
MVEARVKQYWGDRLVPVPENILAGRGPLPRTHLFLTKLGLPRDPPLLVTFYAGDKLLQPLPIAHETYWIVGDDFGTKIGVGRKEDVWSMDPENRLLRRFIGTSVPHFVLFLGLYEAQLGALKEAGDAKSARIVSGLRAQFNTSDPAALANEESWWSVILEQTEQGLM